MTSFFGFSSTAARLPTVQEKQDDTQLEVTVTPAASAFYAGQTFSATIAFRVVRRTGPSHVRPGSVALSGSNGQAQAGSSSVEALHSTPQATTVPRRQRQIGLAIETPPEAYNAVAGPSRSSASRGAPPASMAVHTDSPVDYDSPYSPGANPARGGWPSHAQATGLGGPDAARRYGGVGRRQVGGKDRRTQSLALDKGLSPQEMVWALSGQAPPPLPSRKPNGTGHIPRTHPHSRKISIATQFSLASPTNSAMDLSDDYPSLGSVAESLVSTDDGSRPQSRPQLSRLTSSSSTSSASTSRMDADETPRPPDVGRIPPLPPLPPPPPTHPYIRSLAEPREATILWAHSRLSAHFHPSNHYIPPDPLLPLRSLLLHQPVGSGSLPASPSAFRSRWQLSFGTGTIGAESKPSLTGSLAGLASSLVSSGSAGSLEDERRKAWNTKDLPVFETARSLIGVDIRVKEGEKREFTYSIPIPKDLPSSHRSRAYRFGWEFVVSLAVADGSGPKISEVEVPIRVWSHVALASPQPYSVLKPTIQSRDTGRVREMKSVQALPSPKPKPSEQDTLESLQSYARGVLDTATDKPEANGRGTMREKSSFLKGGEDLGEQSGEVGCELAAELITRQAVKASYDIAKDGDLVSVFTLTKTAYRLGESILGVVDINDTSSCRQVLKVSAFLESTDLIPSALLPLSPRGGRSAQPSLIRVHTQFCAGYVCHTNRLSFNLDIPVDATPGFAFDAKEGDETGTGEEEVGGVEWRIRLAFLVTSPLDRSKPIQGLVPSGKCADNRFFTSTTSLAPLTTVRGPQQGDERVHDWQEAGTETVECEIPIKVLPGDISAIRAKASVHVV